MAEGGNPPKGRGRGRGRGIGQLVVQGLGRGRGRVDFDLDSDDDEDYESLPLAEIEVEPPSFGRGMPSNVAVVGGSGARGEPEPQQKVEKAGGSGAGRQPSPQHLVDEMPTINWTDSTVEKKRDTLEKAGSVINNALQRGWRFAFVMGNTGSGKSTFCVLALLYKNVDMLRQRKQLIFVCLPRTSAARQLTGTLVEMGGVVGLEKTLFGLKTGSDDINFSECLLCFGTAGWLQVDLIHHPENIYNYHTIIIDEVHEMGVDTEMLMGIVMSQQQQHRPNKVFPNLIIMSATMNAQRLFDHFRPESFFPRHAQPKLAEVTAAITRGMNQGFTVEELYLEDLATEMDISVNLALDDITKAEHPKLFPSVIEVLYQTLEKLCVLPDYKQYSKGLMLVCAPGVVEIEKIEEYYAKYPNCISRPIRFLQYHGQMAPKELDATLDTARQSLSEGVPPVLLASPIADSSVTLPECSVVLDLALIKRPGYNYSAALTILEKFWIDEFVTKQRRGRTGRSTEGKYFKLFPKTKTLHPNPTELSRICLNDVYVRILRMAERRRNYNFVSNFITTFLFTKPNKLNLDFAISNLLNTGMIIHKSPALKQLGKEEEPRSMLDHFQLTLLGDYTSTIHAPTNLTRACCIASMLGTFQTIGFITADSVDRHHNRLSFFKNGTQSLRVLHFNLRFADNIPSDHLIQANVFRNWLKSDFVQRSDKKPKKSKPPTEVVPPITTRPDEPVTPVDLFGVNISTLTDLDDKFHALEAQLTKFKLGTRSAVPYKKAGSDEERRLASRQSKLMEMVSLVITEPAQHHFLSSPSEHFSPETDADICLVNSVILQPAPPTSADVRQWGPQLMQLLSRPSNIYPDIYVDYDNDRVVATFPPPAQNTYLGMIHPCVKDALVRAEFEGEFEWMIHYTDIKNDPEASEEDILTSYTKASINNDPLLPKGVTCEEIGRFHDKTKFQIADFKNPHNFGVRILPELDSPNAFVDMSERLKNAFFERDRQHLQPEQAQFGTQIVYLDPKSQMETSVWSQKIWRGIIQSSFLPENLQDVEETVKLQMLVTVSMIDQGVTMNCRLNSLFYYNPEGESNFGIPDLFTTVPRQSYRVFLSTLQPDPTKGWFWSIPSISEMQIKLKKKELGFGARCFLDVHHSSEIKGTITATDLRSIRKAFKETFVEWAVKNNHACRLQDILLDNVVHHSDCSTFCPRPSNTSILEVYLDRSSMLKRRYEAEFNTIDSPVRFFTLNKIYSPLEIAFKQAYFAMDPMPFYIPTQSVNCRPVDFRLAATSATKDNYDPLIAVGTDLRIARKYYIAAPLTTILNPIPSIAPICLMLVYPIIEAFVKKPKGQVVHVKFYRKHMTAAAEFACELTIHSEFDEKDLLLIEKLRHDINSRHVDRNFDINYSYFTSNFNTLLQKKRSIFVCQSLPQETEDFSPPIADFNMFLFPTIKRTYI